MNLYEAVRRRRSIRNYPEEKLREDQLEKVERTAKETNKFHSDIETGAWLVRNGQEFQKDINGLLADYGKVEAPHYFVLTSEDTDKGYVELGYRYEFLVLTLATREIGTCWIGKGFRDEKLRNHVSIPPGQTPGTLIAFGPLQDDDGLYEIDDPKRKRIQGFLINQSSESLDEDTFGIIDCLRRSPSALNGQPWRVIVGDEAIHLYFEPRSKITRFVLRDLNRMNHVDAGIGLCHLKVGGERFWGDITLKKESHPEQKGMKYIGTLVRRS